MLGLGQIARIVGELDSHAVNVRPRQCKRVRHRSAQCTLCIDHCPAAAIEFCESPQISHDRCVGCGICASECPTGALESRQPTNTELLQRIDQIARSGATIIFACPRAQCASAQGVVQVSCLGRVDASIIVGAIARGIRTVDLVDGLCHECPNAIGHTVIEQTLADAAGLLETLGITASINFIPDLPSQPLKESGATVDAVSRRAFFTQLVRGTKRTTAVTAATVLSSYSPETPTSPIRGELPKHLPEARRLLIDSLRRLPISNGAPVHVRPFTGFQVASSCSGCQMCAFFCPTGALTKADEKGRLGLEFTSAHCTNCGLCREICHRHSALADPNVDLTKIVGESSEVIWLNPPAVSFEEKMKRMLQG